MATREAMAVRVHETGGPEVMRWEEIAVGDPGPGQALVRQAAIGVNFGDVLERSGEVAIEERPFVPGSEGAGVVVAVGSGVTDVREGERVAYAGVRGAYAEMRLVPADRLIALPPNVDERTAAATMLKGITARFLLKETFRAKSGQRILIDAAAGGVGLILAQWARYLGATVYGTVGSLEKAALAKANGCEQVILYRHEDVASRVRELTGGEGVDAVFDGVGQSTWEGSLASVRQRGVLVSFGEASGPVPPVEIRALAARGSIYLTSPSLATYTERRDEMIASAKELFDVVARGVVRISIGATWALRDAEEAHRAVESRLTTGSTVLLP